MRIEYTPQVLAFLRSLAPEPRRALVQSIKRLPAGRGDIKPLKGALAGFWHLRVKGYRVIYWQAAGVIYCEFAKARSIIYELFALELSRLRDL